MGAASGARRLWLLAVCPLLACGPAIASFGAHYEGKSRDATEFRLYVDGGEYLGARASLQAIRVTVRMFRQGRPVPARTAPCMYLYDPRDPRRNRIECAAQPGGTLAGAVYARAEAAPAASEAQVLTCLQGCGRRIPRSLVLDAEEDNH